jgi:hypothetical protein
LNKEVSVIEMLRSFSRSKDSYTIEAAVELLENPPDLEEFRIELMDAVSDIIQEGIGKEFTAFVDYYMEPSLEEDIRTVGVPRGDNGFRNVGIHRGDNEFRNVRVRDKSSPWVQGVICYNLSLYIRVYGLSDLKRCKICNKFFAHKGKYAIYCSDVCKAKKYKDKR